MRHHNRSTPSASVAFVTMRPISFSPTRPHAARLNFAYAYVALVVLGVMDFALTYRLVSVHYGQEANPIAKFVLEAGGFGGMAGLKAMVLATVLVCCEVIRRRTHDVAQRLLAVCVILSALPVIWSLKIFCEIWYWTHHLPG